MIKLHRFTAWAPDFDAEPENRRRLKRADAEAAAITRGLALWARDLVDNGALQITNPLHIITRDHDGAARAFTVTVAALAHQTCRICGCTQDRACHDSRTGGGCAWTGADLCSVCERALTGAAP